MLMKLSLALTTALAICLGAATARNLSADRTADPGQAPAPAACCDPSSGCCATGACCDPVPCCGAGAACCAAAQAAPSSEPADAAGCDKPCCAK
jgi:hypothetical protein